MTPHVSGTSLSAQAFFGWVIVPLKWIEHGVYGDPIMVLVKSIFYLLKGDYRWGGVLSGGQWVLGTLKIGCRRIHSSSPC